MTKAISPEECFIVTIDEDGTETEWNIVGQIEVNGRRYVMCEMVEPDDDEASMILRLEANDDGTDSLVPVEDEGELVAVIEALESDLSEENNP